MSVAKHTSLLFFPIGLSVLSAALYLEIQGEGAISPAFEPITTSVQQFKVLNYPESTQLVPLPREWPTVTLINNISSEAPEGVHAKSDANMPPSQANDDEVGLSLSDIDLSSLSPSLALKVENALSRQANAPLQASLSLNDLKGNRQKWRGRLPALNLQTHMYASDAKRRWVKINNVEYHQGEVVDGQVTLKEIQPQAVIVEFQGEQIRIPALYEWQG